MQLPAAAAAVAAEQDSGCLGEGGPSGLIGQLEALSEDRSELRAEIHAQMLGLGEASRALDSDCGEKANAGGPKPIRASSVNLGEEADLT